MCFLFSSYDFCFKMVHTYTDVGFYGEWSLNLCDLNENQNVSMFCVIHPYHI